MDVELLFKIVFWAGLVVVLFMELFKRQWKKAKEKPLPLITPMNNGKVQIAGDFQLPAWKGMMMGVLLTFLVSLVFFMAWLQPATIWVFFTYFFSVFLFQYFVSMEIAKKIVNAFTKRHGIEVQILGGD